MSNSVWRERSRDVIREVTLDFADSFGLHPVCLNRLERSHKAKLIKAIRVSYPFGERKRHPYKAWLEEVRDYQSWLYREAQLGEPLGGLFEEAPEKGE